jgi:O-antigen/teichoic acid export membrane protein
LKGILLASLLHTGVFALIASGTVFWRLGWRFDWHLWRELVRFGLPFIPGGFFLFILNNGDRYFLNVYQGPSVVGLYALGYRLGLLAAILVLTPFQKVWGAVMIEIANRPNGRQEIARIATYFALAYVTAALGLSLVGPSVVRLICGQAYWGASRVIPLVAFAYLFWSLSTIGDTPFYVTKKTDVKPLLAAAAAGVCMVLYAVLIPRWSMIGAALATLISFAVFAGLTCLVAYRYLPVRYEYLRLGKIIVTACLLYAIGHWVTDKGGIVGVVSAFILVFAFPAALYLIRFPTREERSQLRDWGGAAWARVCAFAGAPRENGGGPLRREIEDTKAVRDIR